MVATNSIGYYNLWKLVATNLIGCLNQSVFTVWDVGLWIIDSVVHGKVWCAIFGRPLLTALWNSV